MAGRANFMNTDDNWDLWKIDPPRRRVEFDDRQTEGHQHVHKPIVAMTRNESNLESSYSRVSNSVIGFMSLVSENVLCHPFVVLRRQSQVNRKSVRYHLTPFTLIPVVIRIQSSQGLGSLWKGLGSVMITKGLFVAVEAGLAELTSLPRDVTSQDASVERIAKHLLLKSLSFVIIAPFACSSCIEVVQSIISSDTPGVFDCIKEGLMRIRHWKMSSTTRLLPIWLICGQTLVNNLLYYIVYSVVKKTSIYFIRRKYFSSQKENKTDPSEYIEVISSIFANLVADIVLFPLETVLHRLYLQGTRTIIDNMAQSNRVVPIISNYEGPIDCFNTIKREEGCAGLYKGFGALVFQYTVHFVIIKITTIIVDELIPKLRG